MAVPFAARRPFVLFIVGAALLTGVVVGSPLVTGRAYSQADILFDEDPWRAHRPAGFVRSGNTLLGDVPAIFYPNLSFAREAVRAGRFPTWNPRVYGGQPFVGAMQTAMFSPVTWLTLPIPLPDALTWMYLLRLLLGGLGMFVLLGAVGLGDAARALGGFAWLLAPFSIVWLGHPLAEVAAWLPWTAWATWRACTRGGTRDVALLALFTALGLVAGHPETALKALLLCGALAVAFARAPVERDGAERQGVEREGVDRQGVERQGVEREGVDRQGVEREGFSRAHAAPARALARALAGVLLGLALASAQVLPTLEYLRHSRILADRDRGGPNIYVVPPETLVTAVVPNFLGHPASASYLPMENRYGLVSNYAEQQAYAGIAVWLLAGLGAWHRRRDATTRALVLSGTLAGLLMYGTPGVTTAFSMIPGLRVVVLSRFGLVVSFCAVWLAALGADALVAAPSRVRRRPAVVVAVVMAGLVGASLLFFRRALVATGRLDETLAWTGWALILALATLAAIRRRGLVRLSAPAFAVAAGAVLCADLAVFAWGFHPTIDKRWVFPWLPELHAVGRDTGLSRVIGWGPALRPNTASVYGLSDARGYDGIGPRAWGEMLDVGMAGGHAHEVRDLRAVPLLDLLGVRYVFTPPDVQLPSPHFTRLAVGRAPLWRNERALPRAFLARSFVVARGTDWLRALLEAGDDPRRTVLLDGAPGAEWAAPERSVPHRDAGSPAAPEVGTASVRHYRDTFVQVATTAPEARLLVLTDNFFPGWSVTVDGRPARLLRAYHAVRAVALPPGDHVVEFTYRPRSLRVGAAISLATAVGLVLACVRRRHARAGPPTGRV